MNVVEELQARRDFLAFGDTRWVPYAPRNEGESCAALSVDSRLSCTRISVEAWYALDQACKKSEGFPSITDFNDKASNINDVLAKFDEAILLAKEAL